MFFGFILLIIILFGISFLKALIGVHPASKAQTSGKVTEEQPYQEEEDQNERDSREDSEGDGLIEFDDPIFPPEFDDEDDDP
jgi:hypothetical protein